MRRVEAGEPFPTHAELRAGLKAGIKSRRPEPLTTGNQSAPKATAPSLREEILASFNEANNRRRSAFSFVVSNHHRFVTFHHGNT